MQIKTIAEKDSVQFDREINEALAEGFFLIKRGPTQLTANDFVFYAELVKYDDQSPVDPCGAHPVEYQGCKQCTCDGKCERDLEEGETEIKEVDFDQVVAVMQFIQWCCEEADECSDCPLHPMCGGFLPINWEFEEE